MECPSVALSETKGVTEWQCSTPRSCLRHVSPKSTELAYIVRLGNERKTRREE